MSRTWTLGCDARDPHRLAAFWAQVLGYVPEPDYENDHAASIIHPDGAGPAIAFLEVPEPKAAKNRVHIDVRPAGEDPPDPARHERLIRETVAAAAAAGGSVVREQFHDGRLGNVVMADPEGNEFCVA